ncbi:MAG: Efflux ABC transporter, permease protein [uncultured Propionibacteriaceae bacterium]|uniref:Efflux ABC transporter, permease protein n=1 Tax=uncultured Propionibacteriaceae bacterium TaxID=257457 RepID=A0A6J4PBE7_9ACTN|nr:MAG: Efflux ABC transporter, permease protein [uncultured Propionibacteriaceae bacterium]
MNILDFSPAPGAAPASGRVVAHAFTEARLLVRNGEQLLLALVIPVAILVLGRFLGGQFGELATLAPSVLALAIWSSSFTSVAIATGFERRYGVLERLAATPLGRGGLLAGKAGAVILVVAGQLVILAGTAAALGWRPQFSALSAIAGGAAVLLAIAAFCCLALALAGTLRAEATLALANLVYLVLLVGGALVLPVARYPELVQPVLRLLPTAALGETLRHSAAGQPLWWPLLVLAGWLLVGSGVVAKVFRWTS